MDIVIQGVGSFGKALANQMPAIARRNQQHALGPGAQVAFQEGLQGVITAIALFETEVVNEDEIVVRTDAELLEQVRQVGQPINRQLHQAQTALTVAARKAADRRRFAAAPGTVEKPMLGGQAGEERLGIAVKTREFDIEADQGVAVLVCGVCDALEGSAAPAECREARKDAYAVAAVAIQQGCQHVGGSVLAQVVDEGKARFRERLCQLAERWQAMSVPLPNLDPPVAPQQRQHRDQIVLGGRSQTVCNGLVLRNGAAQGRRVKQQVVGQGLKWVGVPCRHQLPREPQVAVSGPCDIVSSEAGLHGLDSIPPWRLGKYHRVPLGHQDFRASPSGRTSPRAARMARSPVAMAIGDLWKSHQAIGGWTRSRWAPGGAITRFSYDRATTAMPRISRPRASLSEACRASHWKLRPTHDRWSLRVP